MVATHEITTGKYCDCRIHHLHYILWSWEGGGFWFHILVESSQVWHQSELCFLNIYRTKWAGEIKEKTALGATLLITSSWMSFLTSLLTASFQWNGLLLALFAWDLVTSFFSLVGSSEVNIACWGVNFPMKTSWNSLIKFLNCLSHSSWGWARGSIGFGRAGEDSFLDKPFPAMF